MPASLTEEEFSKHVGSHYQLNLNEQQITLELDQVKGYLAGSNEQDGMERFSAFFTGPVDPRLEQGIFRLQHEAMGEFEIFLVPVSVSEKGFRYEAVFNYFKAK